jgi:hypothetical protein
MCIEENTLTANDSHHGMSHSLEEKEAVQHIDLD